MYLRLDIDAERGNVGLDTHVAVSQRAREMQETLGSGSHAGRECVVGERRSGYGERCGGKGVGVEEKIEATPLWWLGSGPGIPFDDGCRQFLPIL